MLSKRAAWLHTTLFVTYVCLQHSRQLPCTRSADASNAKCEGQCNVAVSASSTPLPAQASTNSSIGCLELLPSLTPPRDTELLGAVQSTPLVCRCRKRTPSRTSLLQRTIMACMACVPGRCGRAPASDQPAGQTVNGRCAGVTAAWPIRLHVAYRTAGRYSS
jgi:hypothetical protein